MNDIPRTQQPFVPFRTLWKTDDPQWMAQRKEEWRQLAATVYKDASAKERKWVGRFFLTGKEVGPTEMGMAIEPLLRVFYTPFTTAEQARDLYLSVDSPSARKGLLSDLFRQFCHYCREMPWYNQKVLAIIDGFFGREYRLIQEPFRGRDDRMVTVSPNPSYFCETYTFEAIRLLKGERECSHLLELFGYFLTALPFAEDQSYRANTYIDEMFTEAEAVLAEQAGRSELAHQLAQRLQQQESEIREKWAIHQQAEQV